TPRGGAVAEGCDGFPPGGGEPDRAPRADLRGFPGGEIPRQARPRRSSHLLRRARHRSGGRRPDEPRVPPHQFPPRSGGRRQEGRLSASRRGQWSLNRVVRGNGAAVKTGSFVLVHLSAPREKFWGLLERLDASGATVRGLAVEGFEEWLREITREERPTFSPSTVYFPIHRIERVSLDETIGEAVSL